MGRHTGERNKGRRYHDGFHPSNSSNKKFSERTYNTKNYIKKDKSNKIIYQVSSDGKIVRKWKNIYEISEVLKSYPDKLKQYIDKEKLIGGCLLVMMINYKTTIDYVKLIKYIKSKTR